METLVKLNLTDQIATSDLSVAQLESLLQQCQVDEPFFFFFTLLFVSFLQSLTFIVKRALRLLRLQIRLATSTWPTLLARYVCFFKKKNTPLYLLFDTLILNISLFQELLKFANARGIRLSTHDDSGGKLFL